ncbi:MAG: hypothetical protein HY070_06630 [Chloroflexi bacterium]|nr:hypothetical protein [Chloroflexota bacterium]
MLILSRAEIQQAIAMKNAIAIVRAAFAQLSTQRALVPLRVLIPLDQNDGGTLFMPAFLRDSNALGVKIVSVHHQNPKKNLPLIHALVIVIDATNGKPLAALDGNYLTALRTGAASGVATELLARKNARVGAIIGAGAQARTQLLAICAARELERINIFARDTTHVQTFIAEMREQVLAELRVAATPREAIRDADVICAATSSSSPVFDGNDLKMGAHINAIGSFTPEMQEVDETTLQRANKIVVDARGGALAEAGEIIQALTRGVIRESDIYAEIGEIAVGLKRGREREEEITYFKSVGNAVQDAAVARAVYDAAVKLNLGVEVEI